MVGVGIFSLSSPRSFMGSYYGNKVGSYCGLAIVKVIILD